MRLDALAPCLLVADFPPGPSGNVGQLWLPWPGAIPHEWKSTAWGLSGGASPHSSLPYSSGTPAPRHPPSCSAGPGGPPLHPDPFISRSGCEVPGWVGLSLREDPHCPGSSSPPEAAGLSPVTPVGDPIDHTQTGWPGGPLALQHPEPCNFTPPRCLYHLLELQHPAFRGCPDPPQASRGTAHEGSWTPYSGGHPGVVPVAAPSSGSSCSDHGKST